MKVKNIMQKDPVFGKKDFHIFDIWKLINKKKLLALPIVDKEDRLIGVISIADILKKIYPSYDEYEWDPSAHDLEKIEENTADLNGFLAEDFMSKKVITVDPETPVLKALSKMFIYQIRQLPVVNENKKLVGILTRHEIFDYLFSTYLKKNE